MPRGSKCASGYIHAQIKVRPAIFAQSISDSRRRTPPPDFTIRLALFSPLKEEPGRRPFTSPTASPAQTHATCGVLRGSGSEIALPPPPSITGHFCLYARFESSCIVESGIYERYRPSADEAFTSFLPHRPPRPPLRQRVR